MFLYKIVNKEVEAYINPDRIVALRAAEGNRTRIVLEGSEWCLYDDRPLWEVVTSLERDLHINVRNASFGPLCNCDKCFGKDTKNYYPMDTGD